MRRGDHVNLHDHHGVRLPHEQIESTLDFNRRVLQKAVVSRIYEIIDDAESRRRLYNSEAFKS